MPDPSPGPPAGPLLPDLPLKRSDMPVDGKLHLGRLVAFPAPTGRPLVGVLVTCPRCKRLHRYPWRWDWGLDPDVVSLQQTRCRKPPPPVLGRPGPGGRCGKRGDPPGRARGVPGVAGGAVGQESGGERAGRGAPMTRPDGRR